MEKNILSLFTRTPIHIGAGSSVGAIDQPIVRERHTRFPVIPGSSLKGVISDLWETDENGKRTSETRWLFGEEDATHASAGALLIGEGKLLAFPVRSAKGAFAWTTCPLALARFKRDTNADFTLPKITGEQCFASTDVQWIKQVILEEYVFDVKGDVEQNLVVALNRMVTDAVWQEIGQRLVILSDELFSYFAENACEIAQHIRIDDETGTVATGALFNQENVPSETLFYSLIYAQSGKGEAGKGNNAQDALNALQKNLASNSILQIGADETTGLGWCSVTLQEVR